MKPTFDQGQNTDTVHKSRAGSLGTCISEIS